MRAFAVPGLAVLALLLLPLGLTPYTSDLVMKIMVLAIFALSLGVLGMVWVERYRELIATFL